MGETMVHLTCEECGNQFQRPASKERYRQRRGRKGGPYCGRSCVGKATSAQNIAAWREEHAREEVTEDCAVCGETFTRLIGSGDSAVTCGPQCSARFARAARWDGPLERLMANWSPGDVPDVPGVSGFCWQWEGATRPPYGHPNICVDGKTVGAHRLAFEAYHERKIKPKHVIHHRCLNPSCVNPRHLQEMTHADHLRFHHRSGQASLRAEGA